MDLNNEKLSSGERAEMRAILTSGVRRMKATRARRTRIASVTAAVVLVAGVVTGVSFAALNPIDRVAEPVETTSTPTPTTTPTPTPTPSPTLTSEPVAPAAAVQPFGGACANMLSLDEAAAWMGTPVRTVFPAWTAPELSMNGGLVCTWAVPDAYLWGYVEVTVFPSKLFQPIDTAPTSEGECTEGVCRAAAVVDGMWIVLEWVGSDPAGDDRPMRSIGGAEFAELFALLGQKARNHEQPQPAERATSWWPPFACDVVAENSPHLTRQESWPSELGLIDRPVQASELGETGVDGCGWSLPDGQSVTMMVVPGGGVMFDRIAGTELAQPIDVEGSEGAVLLPNHFVWEFNGNDLVVRSGDNLLIVGNSGVEQTEAMIRALVETAQSTLPVLNATLG